MKKFVIAAILSGLTLSTGVLAQTAETTTAPVVLTATTATPTVKAIERKLDLACMQTSVEKRDNAIIAAWDKFTPAIKTALETRKTALKSAWTNTDKKARREAIKKTWTDYRDAVKTTRKTFNSERKAVWKTFNVERKSCGGLPDDATTEAVDNQL